jgi:hypothetical protein
MRPYTKAMYDAIGSYSTRHVRHSLPSLAKVDVAVWRAFLLLSRLDLGQLNRPIASFVPRQAALVFKFDASLRALAVGVYFRVSESSPLILLAFTVIHLPYPTTEARKQNTYEYLCVSIGMLLTHMLGIHNQSCELHGDSKSSLAWSLRDRADSVLARRSNIGFTLAGALYDINTTVLIHVPGLLNKVYDGLSRNLSAREVGLPPDLQVYFPPTHPVHRFVQLCNPDSPLDGYLAHAQLSQNFAACISDSNMRLPNPIILPAVVSQAIHSLDNC